MALEVFEVLEGEEADEQDFVEFIALPLGLDLLVIVTALAHPQRI